jgi:hypothetical protein
VDLVELPVEAPVEQALPLIITFVFPRTSSAEEVAEVAVLA